MSLSMIKEWIDKAGIALAPGISPVGTDTKGLALKAADNPGALAPREENDGSVEPQADEDVVVQVPADMILDSQRIYELAADDKLLQQWIEVDNCTGTQLLHRGLLYLWLVKDKSAWKEYLDLLPRETNLPFSYSIKDMQGLDFSAVSLHYAALMKRLEIEKTFERFIKSDVGRASGVTLSQWLIPHKWISSRGLTHPFTGKTCLVPAVDLCNHSSKSNNVRYDVDSEGNFELRVLPNSSIANQELYLDYGNRSTGEFVFNYGFIPDDRTEADFDEIFKVFDPSDEGIRNVLDVSRDSTVASQIDSKAQAKLALSYDLLLDFFAEEIPQVLRIVRLPQLSEYSETKRYRFHNHFIMALACMDKLELKQDEDGQLSIYLDNKELVPKMAFEMVLSHEDPAIIQRAKLLVARLCNHFCQQVLDIANSDPMISELAKSEASIYGQYAKLNGSESGGLAHEAA